jgi:hypothetical protein
VGPGQGDYRVLAAKMVQDKAIYIYIDDETRVEPRPLLLPWDNDTANAIQRALDGAPDGSEGEFMMSYEPSLDMTEQQFHAVPPEPAPAAEGRARAGAELRARLTGGGRRACPIFP